jgi:hypothetical protein
MRDAAADIETAFLTLFRRQPDRQIPLYEDLDSLDMIQLFDLLESDFAWVAPAEMEIDILESIESLAAFLIPTNLDVP